jgi:hypothetical protein
MVKENINVVKRKWHLVLKTLGKRYEAYAEESQEANSVIDLVRGALVNTLKCCPPHSSCTVMVKTGSESRRRTNKQRSRLSISGQQRALPSAPWCYASTQLRMRHSLQLSIEENCRSTQETSNP